jgi:catechol 2,3-dioxygenase-like lactoylglutathione lyase family enzyme
MLDHLVLEVADPARSVLFYRDVLGLRPVRLREFVAGQVSFPSARVTRNSVLDFFPPRMWRGRRAANPNHFCLTLSRAAIAALSRRLKRRGIAIEREHPHNFGARGFGVALYFRDPDGLLLEARYYPSAP